MTVYKRRRWSAKKEDERPSIDGITMLHERMLQTAINDLACYGDEKEEYQEAHCWLFGQWDEDDIPVSFEDVCEALFLNKERVKFSVQGRMDQRKLRFRDFEYRDFLEQCRQ